MKIYVHDYPEIYAMNIFFGQEIKAAINTTDISKNLVRCKSSNLWAYGINVKEGQNRIGDVVIQFKGKRGGPGDTYIYYDVPVKDYRRLVGAPSKGSTFWKFFRNKFKYDKLGDKSWHGKLPNAIR